MSYPLDIPRRRSRRRLAWWEWLIVIPLVAAVVFAIDGLVTLAAMWVLTQFGVDAPFWPTFAGVLLAGLITGGGSRR